MKKNAMFSILAIGLSFSSYGKIGGSLSVDMRPEYVSIDNDFKNTGNKDVAKFQSEYNRIYLKGKVNESLNYYFRYNFNTSGESKSLTDKTVDQLEYAYLTQNLAEGLNFSFGKMWYLFGGREYDYDGKDVYTYSDAILNIPFYEMGAMLDYTIGDQTFYLQGLNPSEVTNSSTSDTEDISNSIGLAVGWYGNFMKGMIKPIVSYGIRPFSRQAREDKHLAVGFQLNASKLQFEYDYLAVESELEAGAKGDEYLSHIVVARYAFTDKFRPHVKLISDEKKTTGTKQYEKMSYDVALEYYPRGGDDYSTFLVYSSADKKAKVSSETKSTINTIRFGFKLRHSLFEM